MLKKPVKMPTRPRKKPVKRWPRWIDDSDEVNLREVAPNLYVGAEYASLHPPTGKKWELVVDWYGCSERYPNRVRDTSKRTLCLPFLDGAEFPPGALDKALKVLAVARRQGPVLVACQAGLSRSASATYGLMRRIGRLPHAEALRRVRVPDCPEFPRTATLASARAWAERRGVKKS